ncbi:Gfo/Idh/MocA family protein [Pseudoroseicyclus tamaricis]|uniref:Gfo/Idh/MocA family oxidoreductase n=1 Tax=Pseudoroseicyclus tamaricis TaxID=2705421 RepID=A0A6B2JWH5_9RHOB|nr:Gfo/Idh/MocA family oxidoreductase [Pseudoroseicyclus tamaricis]NDV00564.1 Gfo/Idh/MocA family oxidoreductase [Pseudoroseicyclus tamaricis]
MLTAAIAGYGNWGRKLVASVAGKSDELRFGVIVSRNPDRVAEDAARLGAAVVTTLEEALAHPSVEAVVLATPHSMHAEQVKLCAAAGKPVFVEKPFALTHDSAAEALACCPADMVVAAGHNRRFLPSVTRLAEEIAAGTLGDILFAETNFSGNVVGKYAPGQWRSSGAESPAGGLAGAGIHMIDLIVHLMAPISAVVSLSDRQVLEIEMDDTTAALLRLENGASATLVSIMATVPTFRAKFHGTRASAELDGETRLILTRPGDAPEIIDFDPVETERLELEAFAAAIAGGRAYPVSRGEILNGIKAFEAVGASAEVGGWVTL